MVSSPETLSGFLRFRHKDGAATSAGASPVAGSFMIPRKQSGRSAGLAVYNADDKDLPVVFRMEKEYFIRRFRREGKSRVCR